MFQISQKKPVICHIKANVVVNPSIHHLRLIRGQVSEATGSGLVGLSPKKETGSHYFMGPLLTRRIFKVKGFVSWVAGEGGGLDVPIPASQTGSKVAGIYENSMMLKNDGFL